MKEENVHYMGGLAFFEGEEGDFDPQNPPSELVIHMNSDPSALAVNGWGSVSGPLLVIES